MASTLKILSATILSSLILTTHVNSEVSIPKAFDFAGAGPIKFSDGSWGIQVNLKVKKPIYTGKISDVEKDELDGNLKALCWIYMPKIFQEIKRARDTKKYTVGVISVSWESSNITGAFFSKGGWRNVYKLDTDKCGEII